MILTETSWAGVGLAGNPSDGCFGKAVAVPAANYSVSVTLYESPEINFTPTAQDHDTFDALADLSEDVERYGYYGGIRLLKAAAKAFFEFCEEAAIALADRKFTARYESCIPRRVGLAESSAVVTATLRALVRFYEAPVDPVLLPVLAWRTERAELGIPCGLMDRVVQTYGRPVHMDLDEGAIERDGHGRYDPIAAERIPPLLLALPEHPSRAGQSDYHRALGVRLHEEDSELPARMREFAGFADEARDALVAGDMPRLGAVMNRNFDLRRQLFPIPETEANAVAACRDAGFAAKLAGGSGTLVALPSENAETERLAAAVADCGYTLKPLILPEARES